MFIEKEKNMAGDFLDGTFTRNPGQKEGYSKALTEISIKTSQKEKIKWKNKRNYTLEIYPMTPL